MLKALGAKYLAGNTEVISEGYDLQLKFTSEVQMLKLTN